MVHRPGNKSENRIWTLGSALKGINKHGPKGLVMVHEPMGQFLRSINRHGPKGLIMVHGPKGDEHSIGAYGRYLHRSEGI